MLFPSVDTRICCFMPSNERRLSFFASVMRRGGFQVAKHSFRLKECERGHALIVNFGPDLYARPQLRVAVPTRENLQGGVL